jgi:hypothetical protein
LKTYIYQKEKQCKQIVESLTLLFY